MKQSDIPIDIHADDYALTVNTSREILGLIRDGVLDSISIVPNMDCFDECMDLLKSEIPHLTSLPQMSVHLNLVEGLQLSGAADGSNSVLISSTWKSLFLASYNPLQRNTVKQYVKKEISAQIGRVQPVIEECINIARQNNVRFDQTSLRIDSHQHTHMIPVVWYALCEYLAENNLTPEYIRNSKEPLMPFIASVSLWKTYSPVNIVKNRILNFYSGKCDRYYRRNGHKPMYLWGLVMSGRMDQDRIEQLYPSLIRAAGEKSRSLEILFHPGRMLAGESWEGIPEDAANNFYLSDNRDTEKDGARCARELT